jgi:hypothetical protein
MRKIYSSEDRFLVQRIKDALEAAGYECHLRNQYAAGGAGDLSPFECWPEVWLVDEGDYDAALDFLHKQFESMQQGGQWQCHQCGEMNEPAFGICWKCGAEQKSGH